MRTGLVRFFCALATGALLTGHANAIVMDTDARVTLADYALRGNERMEAVAARFSATGIVTCGDTHSTAQLTVRNDVITTAAHAFYDPQGNLRTDPSACIFTAHNGDRHIRVAVDGPSLMVGSHDPYAEPGVKDWAVARLVEPVVEATPYTLAPEIKTDNILLVANRHQGWAHDGVKAVEACTVRAALQKISDAPRELAIDCSTGQGASGSALMLPGAPGAMIGIYVGWRSAHPARPGPFAANHYNYGLAIEGPFREAIHQMTQQPMARLP